MQSSHSSPQIEYSDIIQVQDLPESEREDEGSTEEASILSDLYASVQTQRIKTIEPTGDVEGYANHLWEEVMVKRHMQFRACRRSTTGWRCGTVLQYPKEEDKDAAGQTSADWRLSVWIVVLKACPIWSGLFILANDNVNL